MSVRTLVKISSPFAYIALFLAIAYAAGLGPDVTGLVLGPDSSVFLYVVIKALIFGVVFFLGGWVLLALERLQRPKLVDHLRRCALLYLLFAPGSVSFFLLVDLSDPGAGGSLAITLCIAAGYAIVIDALLLLVTRRRSHRLAFGGYA